MSKIAMVIPVYNVEKYIVECLESILGQTCLDWECFVVNDGSTRRFRERSLTVLPVRMCGSGFFTKSTVVCQFGTKYRAGRDLQ